MERVQFNFPQVTKRFLYKKKKTFQRPLRWKSREKEKEEENFPKGGSSDRVSQLKIPTIQTIRHDFSRFATFSWVFLVGQWGWLDPSIRDRVQWPCRGEAILRSTGPLSWAAPWIMGFVDELNPIGPVFNSLAHRLTRERSCGAARWS